MKVELNFFYIFKKSKFKKIEIFIEHQDLDLINYLTKVR